MANSLIVVNYLAEIPNFSARARAQRSSQPEAARFERICRVDPADVWIMPLSTAKKGRALAESKENQIMLAKLFHQKGRNKQFFFFKKKYCRISLGLPLASRAAPAVGIWHIGKAAAKANTRPWQLGTCPASVWNMEKMDVVLEEHGSSW